MSDQPASPRPKWGTAAIVGVLLALVVVVTVIGLLTAGTFTPASARKAAAAPAETSSAAATPIATSTVSAAATTTPTRSASATSKPSASPTPQPTKTASISQSTPAAIKKELSVKVVKMEAVTGTADGPGEIAGPSVRFTIRIENATGKSVGLSNTVVNAYYGSEASPAVQLRLPGGKDFPPSVADGDSASGVYLFNIPKDGRSDVRVTVDTSVNNPVIAFQGAAPNR